MKKILTLALSAACFSTFAQTAPPASTSSNTPATQDDNMSSTTMKGSKMHKSKMGKMDKTDKKMDKKMGKMDKMDKKM